MRGRRVLIVEDEPDTAELIRGSLARAEDLDPRAVSSGEAALTAAANTPPDIVVLDVSLPGISGVAVCRALRAQPETRDVPILMLTARTSEEDRISGFDAGADDYMLKP